VKQILLTVLASALAAVAVVAGEVAYRYQTGAQVLTAVLLASAAAVALCAVGGAMAAGVFCVVTERRQRHLAAAYTPPDHPLWPYGAPDPVTQARDVRIANEIADEYAARATHARRAAMAPVRDGFTRPLPSPWTPPVAEPVGGGR
jgi:hypothetical protein